VQLPAPAPPATTTTAAAAAPTTSSRSSLKGDDESYCAVNPLFASKNVPVSPRKHVPASSLRPQPAQTLKTVPISNADEDSDLEADNERTNVQLVGNMLPFDPKLALGLLTTRFYCKSYGGVQQLRQDLLVTLEKLDDAVRYALELVLELKLKPFNKKRGHYRVLPKLLLRVLAVLEARHVLSVTEAHRHMARDVLQVLQNNTFGKKTINKFKSLMQLNDEPTTAATVPIVTSSVWDEEDDNNINNNNNNTGGASHSNGSAQMTTGVNPLFVGDVDES